MKKSLKLIISIVFTFMFVIPAFSQQITKFGVVDTAQVYNAYFRNSAPVRNYEKKKEEFQTEINKRTDELRQLQNKRLEYESNGDEASALKVEAEITKKKDYITEYTNHKHT